MNGNTGTNTSIHAVFRWNSLKIKPIPGSGTKQILSEKQESSNYIVYIKPIVTQIMAF